jgi:hypothetical protein
MQLGIITANFGRVPILEIFAEGITRLRNDTGLSIPTVCVGSEDGAETCKSHSIDHIIFPNSPLTAKFNRACLELKDKVDYVMVLGSDNLLSTKAFKAILCECEKGIDLIGLSEVYFYCMDDIHTGKLIHFKHTTVLGVGRTVSARVLDNLSWQPWVIARDRAIDVIMLDAVRPYVQSRSLLDGEFVVDLKTSQNINNVRFWAQKLGYMPSESLLWDNISPREIELIKNYLNNR